MMTAPTPEQVRSACLSYRHDYGLLSEAERKAVQFEALEWLHAWRKEGQLGLAQSTGRITEEMVENGCRGMYGKHWDGPKDKEPGPDMKEVWRKHARKCLEAALAPGHGAHQLAPVFKASQNTAESDPSVRTDWAGADTGRITTEQLDRLQFGRPLHERPGNAGEALKAELEALHTAILEHDPYEELRIRVKDAIRALIGQPSPGNGATKSSPAAHADEETGWLIERGEVKPEMIHYFCFDIVTDKGVTIKHWSWTSDNLSATRFSRRIDAELAWQCATQRDLSEVDIVEHMWCRPRAGNAGALDRETIQTLLDLLNPLHGELDRQTYDEKVRDDFDAPRDKEYSVNITGQMESDLTQAVLILENRKAAAAPPATQGDGE